MSARTPTLSIVLPNYNHARELHTSLGAIVGQTRPADEIVIVDDGSTDDSLSVIAAFAANCPALRLVRHEQRQGVVAAVNRGVREATGDYVILASADERLMPDCCAEMERALALYPQAKLVVARFTEWFPETSLLRHGADGACDLWFLTGDAPEWVSPERFHALLADAHVRLSVNSAMFARQVLVDLGPFDPALRWHSDWFAIYTAAFRYGFCAIPHTVSWFRVAPQSYSVTGAAIRAEQDRVVSDLFAKLDQPEYRDIRSALLRSPSAMAPFMRAMLMALLKRPDRYGDAMSIGAWWLKDVARGRRPQSWARIVARMKGQRPPAAIVQTPGKA